MKSKSILKKMVMFAIVLSLVLSVAGTALANGLTPNWGKVKVCYDWNGGTGDYDSLEFDVQFDNCRNAFYAMVYLPDKSEGALENYELIGWSLGAPGATVRVSVTGGFDCCCWHWNDISTSAQWAQVLKTYILHYDITPAVTGQPVDPADEEGSEPIQPTAQVSMSNYYFTGWEIGEYTLTSSQPDTVNELPVIRECYEATATGFFTQMELQNQTLYSLLYTGYLSNAVFWPGNVIESPVQPGLAGDPILAGYTFLGWTPALLDWTHAAVTTRSEVVTPVEGEPYLLVTTIKTLTVEGAFSKIVTPEEIPLDVPQTGSADGAAYAAVLAVLAAAAAGFAMIRGRKKDS